MKQLKQNYYQNEKLDFEQNFKMFLKCPTLLWFVDWTGNVDTWLDFIAFTGIYKTFTTYSF